MKFFDSIIKFVFIIKLPQIQYQTDFAISPLSPNEPS